MGSKLCTRESYLDQIVGAKTKAAVNARSESRVHLSNTVGKTTLTSEISLQVVKRDEEFALGTTGTG